MTNIPARQPEGIPTGGQFAAATHSEASGIRLASAAPDENRQDAIDHLESRDFSVLQVSDADREILGRALRREPVSPEEVDAALERNWEAEYPGPDADTYYSGIATQVFNEVRADRAASGIPSTVPTLANFDPATQSVFESDEDRHNALRALEELQYSSNDSFIRTDRAERLQSEVEYLERSNAKPGNLFPDDTRPVAARAAGATAGAARADARMAAIIAEMRWLAKNDEDYAFNAGPAVMDVIGINGLQPDADPNTPIAPSIRKVQGQA